jgi:hypothetical protein
MSIEKELENELERRGDENFSTESREKLALHSFSSFT